MADFNFPLEALREAKNWSIWVLGISGTLATGTGIFSSFSGSIKDANARDAKFALVAGSVSSLCAIAIASGVPYLIVHLPMKEGDDVLRHALIFGISISTFNYIMNTFAIFAGFFLMSIFWRETFGTSFLDTSIYGRIRGLLSRGPPAA